MASLLDGVWESIANGGVTTPTHRLMNAAFYGLFATLFALLILSKGNIHVLALFVLAVGLFIAVNWYV